MHLTPEADGSGVFDVVATGGAAGAGGAKSGPTGTSKAFAVGSPASMLRLFYRVAFTPAANATAPFTVQLQDVADNHQYPW